MGPQGITLEDFLRKYSSKMGGYPTAMPGGVAPGMPVALPGMQQAPQSPQAQAALRAAAAAPPVMPPPPEVVPGSAVPPAPDSGPSKEEQAQKNQALALMLSQLPQYGASVGRYLDALFGGSREVPQARR